MRRIFNRGLPAAARLVAVIPPLVILALAYVLLKREVRVSGPELLQLIAGEVSSAFGVSLQARSLDVGTPGILVAHGVALGKPGYGRLIFAEVRVRYDLRRLLSDSGSAAAAVISVDVRQPTVDIVRYGDGRINIVEAFRPRKKAKEPFRGTISVRGATVVFTDLSPPSGAGRAVLRAEDVTGGAQFGCVRGLTFSLRAARTSVGRDLTVRGWSGGGRRLALAARCPKLDLARTGAWAVPLRSGFALTGGTAEAEAFVTYRRGARPSVWVKARTRAAGVRFPRAFPGLTAVDARITAAGADAVSFEGTATAAGSRWRAKGAYFGAGGRPAVWVDAASASADLGRLAAAAPGGGKALAGVRLSGAGPVSVKVRGALSDPAVTGEVLVPRVSYRRWEVSDARARFRYAQGKAALDSLRAKAGGGRLTGSVSASLGRQPRARGEFAIQGLDVSWLDRRVQGSADARGRFSLAGGALSADVDYLVRYPGAAGLKATTARGSASLYGRTLRLARTFISTPGGFAQASGMVGLDGEVDLAVTLLGVKLSTITGNREIGGILDAAGSVRGTLRDPRFSGRVQALDVAYQGERFDAISGQISLSRSEVASQKLLITRGLAEAELSGSVRNPLSERRRFQLSGAIKGWEISDLASRFPVLKDLSGVVSGQFSGLAGTWPDLAARFSLNVENARYGTFGASRASLAGRYEGGRTVLESFQATRGEASLKASGIIGKDGTLDLAFGLQGFPADEMLLLATGQRPPLTGEFSADGRISGTSSAPEVAAAIHPCTLTLAGRKSEVSGGSVEWSNGLATVRGVRLAIAGGLVSLDSLSAVLTGEDRGLRTAEVGLGDESGQQPDIGRLLGTVRSLGLVRLLDDPSARKWLLEAPEHVRGSVRGSLRARMGADGLHAAVSLAADGASAWGVPLGHLEMEGSVAGPLYDVSRLALDDGETTVRARASYDRRTGAIAADVEGNNIPLASLPLRGRLQGAKGLGDFSLQASGTAEAPRVRGSALVRDAVVAGVAVERFTTGLVMVDSDSVDFTEATITSGQHTVRAAGTVPFSLAGRRMLPARIDVRAELEQPTLDLLALLTRQVDPERTDGPLEARLALSGEWPHPMLSGVVRVQNGTLGLQGVRTLLRDINVLVTLEGTTARVEQFRVSSSDGGELNVTGGARMAEDGLVLDLAAAASGFGLDLKNASGVYNESLRAKLDVDLRAAGRLLSPAISGEVVARGGYVGLPVVPEQAPERQPSAFDPSFDLRLVVGKGLSVRGPRLNVGVGGALAMGGSWNQPAVTGSLVVQSGYLLFPGSRFRVIPEGSITFRWAPPEQAQVSVDIKAETRVSAASSPGAGRARSYRLTMHLRGPLANPQFGFQSYPPGLNTTGALALLGQQAGIGPSGLDSQQSFQQQVSQLFTANIVPGVLEPVEALVAERLGLEEFVLGFGGRYEPAYLQVTGRVLDRLSLSVLQSIGADDRDVEWTLLYDVLPNIRLTYGATRDGLRSVGLEGAVRF